LAPDSKARPTPHYRELPTEEFNDTITETLPIYCDSFTLL